jgi:hypothetical protein
MHTIISFDFHNNLLIKINYSIRYMFYTLFCVEKDGQILFNSLYIKVYLLVCVHTLGMPKSSSTIIDL